MRMISKSKKWATLLLLLLAGSLTAQVKVPTYFSNNMVLQKGMAIPVWGWATPGEKVTVTIDQSSMSTTADKEGKWNVKLSAMNYGGPYQLTIQGKTNLSFENVMIGEVWVCSGQSNMEFQLITSKNGEAEVAASNYPNIRLFTVKKTISHQQQEKLQDGEWSQCSPATSSNFSAVGYFFGRELHQKLNVAIGLINSSWGGTIAETWTSEQTIGQNPDFTNQLAQLKKINLDDYAKSVENEVKQRVGETSTIDKGMKNGQALWAAPAYNDAAWKTMELPGYIESNGLQGVDGIVWFRKEITLSADEAKQKSTLYLAKINDSDSTYINGVLIGSTRLQAEKSRVYSIDASLLKPGKNIITVRIEDIGGMGGVYGNPATLYLQSGDHNISLVGSWKYKVGIVKFNAVLSPNSYPTLLYNAMIHPLVPFAIKGAIWYQGESNAERAKQYRRVFPDLIKDWRAHWNQGDFPFLFVQLANFKKQDSIPVESDWAELREAQTMTLALPNTGMAVTTDVGEALDIHPKNKQTVGLRLALAGLKVAYQKDIVYTGPVYQSMNVEGNKVTLTFDQIGSGIKIKDKYGYLKGFAIAGEDHQFHWATGKITGVNTLQISSSEVQHPVAVRYAWSNNPEDANLYNSADLPASSFRTDNWKGITQ
jgi:sialate O-acetylesterase